MHELDLVPVGYDFLHLHAERALVHLGFLVGAHSQNAKT